MKYRHIEDIPYKHYDFILCDPPWAYNNTTIQGGAANHYSTLSTDVIENMPVHTLAKKDAYVAMWQTHPMIMYGACARVANAWGLEGVTLLFNWIKLNSKARTIFQGIGHYTRSNSEPCYLYRYGKPKLPDKHSCISQILMEPRGEHSAKPSIHEHIVALFGEDLNYLEMFARKSVKGWDSFGDEL